MSFSKIWRTFRIKLLSNVFGVKPSAEGVAASALHAEEAIAAYESAMSWAVKDTLPNRPGRSFKRQAYHWTPHANRFPKRPTRPPDLK